MRTNGRAVQDRRDIPFDLVNLIKNSVVFSNAGMSKWRDHPRDASASLLSSFKVLTVKYKFPDVWLAVAHTNLIAIKLLDVKRRNCFYLNISLVIRITMKGREFFFCCAHPSGAKNFEIYRIFTFRHPIYLGDTLALVWKYWNQEAKHPELRGSHGQDKKNTKFLTNVVTQYSLLCFRQSLWVFV